MSTATAKMGHDLVLEATKWSGKAQRPDYDPAVELQDQAVLGLNERPQN